MYNEVVTCLCRKAGGQMAARCGEWILSTSHVALERVDESTWLDAWRMFLTCHDKAWSFKDGTSFVLMPRHQLRHAFTFDPHFAQAGFQLWPIGEGK